jgi:hypothetical protein
LCRGQVEGMNVVCWPKAPSRRTLPAQMFSGLQVVFS